MRFRLVLLAALVVALVPGCGQKKAITQARRTLRTEDVPHVLELVREGRRRHLVGIGKAARLIAPSFAVADETAREARIRQELTALRNPPRGIEEFVVGSPMSFLAAIATDGRVIARDGDAANDHLRGMNLSTRFDAVRDAIKDGRTSVAQVEFEPLERGGESSVSILYVAPVRDAGGVIGAVACGVPLKNEAYRLSRQIRLDHAAEVQQGLVLWAYLYRGERLFFKDTSPDIDEMIPRAGQIATGLSHSPRGYSESFVLHGRAYAYAVVPVPSLGEGVGLILVRSAE